MNSSLRPRPTTSHSRTVSRPWIRFGGCCLVVLMYASFPVAQGFISPSTRARPWLLHHDANEDHLTMLMAARIKETETTKSTATPAPRRKNNNNNKNKTNNHGSKSKPLQPQNNNNNNKKPRAHNTNSNHTQINNHKNNKKNPKSADPKTLVPWKAGYYTSVKTQQNLQQTATHARGTAVERCTAIWQTLLQTPSTKCNSANLVCALTLSAKPQVSSSSPPSAAAQQAFTSSFLAILEILRDMVSLNLLTGRQLCNAIWAVAKLCDRHATLLVNDSTKQQVALSSDDQFGIAEEWSLEDEDVLDHGNVGSKKNNSPQQQKQQQSQQEVLQHVIDQIAVALTAKLQANSTVIKNGELCMACWAYGILRERNRPPGWKTRPRLGQVPRRKPAAAKTSSTFSSVASFVRFEQWDMGQTSSSSSSSFSFQDDDDNAEEEIPMSVSDILFDEIAMALCQPVSMDRLGAHQPASVAESNDDDANKIEMDHHDDEEDDEPFFQQRIDTCRWSELANVAWAFATHGWSSSESAEQLLSSISRETVQRLHRGLDKPASRDIAQLIWSLGIAQSDNFRLAHALIHVVQALREKVCGSGSSQQQPQQPQRPFAYWSCADLVQVALSLAHARLDEQELLRALYQEAIRRLPQEGVGSTTALSGDHNRKTLFFWEITILLWAQARLHLTEAQSPSFASFATKAIASIQAAAVAKGDLDSIGLGAQEKANLAWSMVILEQYQTPEAADLISRIFVEAASECDDQGCMQLEHAHQMWQALFLVQHENPDAVAQTPDWFYDYLQSKWKQEKARPKLSSARHRALSQALTQMGVAHLNEHDEDIDVAIVLKPNAMWTHQTTTKDAEQSSSVPDNIRVAVEFDGPNHFTRQVTEDGSGESNSGKAEGGPSTGGPFSSANKPPPPRSLGHSVLKYRLLKKQGWNVIRVPYYEFDKIPFWASMERQRYLQRLLKTHSVLKFSERDISQYQPHVIADRKSRFD